MAIVNLQRRQTEVGRIRLGAKVPTSTGKMRPSALDRLRFTSPRRDLIKKVAELYGGTVGPWEPPRGNAQWEVITDATSVPVMVPPQDPAESQWYEAWSAGGCLRRCTGEREVISGGPCVCDPEDRDCKMHTRIQVMLAQVPGIGVWRVDTGSYYAATELPGVAELLSAAGGIIPGRLLLSERTITRNRETKKFVVPVLDIDEFTPDELLSGKVPELAAERRAVAIDGRSSERAAIGSGPDLMGIVRSADSKEHLGELWKQFGAEGVELTPELKRAFEETAAGFDEVVEAEIVEEVAS